VEQDRKSLNYIQLREIQSNLYSHFESHWSKGQGFLDPAAVEMSSLTLFAGLFDLHLKECEWRYNKASPELIASLKALVKNKSLMAQGLCSVL